MVVLSLLMAVDLESQLIMLPEMIWWLPNYNHRLMRWELSGLHRDTTYYAWHMSFSLLDWAHRLWAFTCIWLQNPQYSDYRPLDKTQDEWTIIKYVLEVFGRFRYWTLWMSKRHTVPLHHVIAVYHDIFNSMYQIMPVLAKKKTQWKEDSFIVGRFAHHKLCKYFINVTPMMDMLLISSHILDPFQKLQSFTKWDNRMDSNPEDKT